MKKIILFAVSFLCAAATARAQQPSTGAADAGVPVEEYVPKVIIEGKWGAGPGEFGVAGVTLDDFNPISPTMAPVYPSSLAVDGAGNIYVLDIVNNRIQKFSPEGKYLKAIKIDSWTGYVLNPKAEGVWESMVAGINIVIDSKDILYYYLKHIKDGKETGEVWEFREDKLVRKLTVPVTNSLSSGVGLELDREDDSLTIPNVGKNSRGKHYDVRARKGISSKDAQNRRDKFRTTEAGRRVSQKLRSKYYLDIVVYDAGIKIVQKLN